MFIKLLKNPLGIIGTVVIVSCFLVAVFAYHIIPDNSKNANRMELVIGNKPPGFRMKFLVLPAPTQEKSSFFSKLVSGDGDNYQEIPILGFREGKDSVKIKEYIGDNEGQWKSISKLSWQDGFDASQHLVSKKYVLGTDKFGRDVLSRVVLGTRISFAVGFISVLISLIIGIPLGLLAGYFGGMVDKIIMWIINVVWSIPGLLMVIAITLALGKGFYQVFIAIGFTMWVEVARVVRGQVLSIREREYIQASRVLGFSHFRVMFKHILPNAMAPIIVISAANFAAAILVESGLSFLGIGAQPPVPSWGGMIKDHYSYLVVGKAYLALAPGFAIMILVLAFMMLGNAMRDVLDVKA